MTHDHQSRRFAFQGGPSAFEEPLPVGQFYFPELGEYRASMEGIFDREYYTNHGPIAQELELHLADFLDVRHVIVLSNATIGLTIAALALELEGTVVTPAFTFAATPQSIVWAGLRPVLADVDPVTHHITPATIDRVITAETQAILAVNLWGGASDIEALTSYAAVHNLRLYFDSAQAFGCAYNNTPVGRFGELEVFSFHATKILNATEGGCITTNNDQLAAKVRAIRSSYGIDTPASVPLKTNARLSEAQAAIALMSLASFHANRRSNVNLHVLYRELLREIPGVTVLKPSGVTDSNFQYLILSIDSSEFGCTRDRLLTLLHNENIIARRYFYPGIHRVMPIMQHITPAEAGYPVTEALSDQLLQLPIGARVTADDAALIATVIAGIGHAHRGSEMEFA